jgi:hypothetical protein
LAMTRAISKSSREPLPMARLIRKGSAQLQRWVKKTHQRAHAADRCSPCS